MKRFLSLIMKFNEKNIWFFKHINFDKNKQIKINSFFHLDIVENVKLFF